MSNYAQLGTTQMVLQVLEISSDLFKDCTNTYYLRPNSVTVLQSPYYSFKYPSGSACLYNFVAPLDYEILAECSIDLDRNPTACSSEYFYVSREGDRNLTDADQFCGKGNLTRTTLFRNLVIAYTSGAAKYSGIGGKFTCTLTTRPQPCDCGWSMKTRIVGGQDAPRLEYPSMVGLFHKLSQRVFCGGAIINHRTVVTATHCTRFFANSSDVLLVAGYHKLPGMGGHSQYAANYTIYKYIEYPNYDPKNDINDIVLVITNDIIEWSRGVGPICLPLNDLSNNFDFTNVTLIGWGTTSYAGSRPDTLQETTVNILSNSACENVYPNLQSSQVCTYYKNRDSCQFDSGGPVILKDPIREYLLAVISFGNPCGFEPGVNTRITSYAAWIVRNSAGTLCFKPR